MTPDDVVLPELPSGWWALGSRSDAIRDYARAAILADRERRGEGTIKKAIQEAYGAEPTTADGERNRSTCGRCHGSGTVEHAEYMAKAAESFMAACGSLHAVQQAADDGEGMPDDLDRARADQSEAWAALKNAIYEFRKRRDRAVAERAGAEPVQAPASDAPPCWWIDHGSYGQITQREEEALTAACEGKRVVRYWAAPVQEQPSRETVANIVRSCCETEPADPDHHGLDTDRQVFFYEQDFYVLSNFSAFNLVWEGITFPTSEHAYHWEKFATEDDDQTRNGIAYQIMEAPSAHAAFKIAETQRHLRRSDWDDVKVDVMLHILQAKVAQHKYVRRKLLATGDRELIENSWRDDFWGWGPNRDGQNMLGKLWMEIRSELRRSPQRTLDIRFYAPGGRDAE